MNNVYGFQPQISEKCVLSFLRAMKRRKFHVRKNILRPLAELFYGPGTPPADFREILISGMWVKRLTEMGVMPEAIAGLKAATSALLAESEDLYDQAQAGVAEVLESFPAALKKATAARQEVERKEVEELRRKFSLLFFEHNVRPDNFPTGLYFSLQKQPRKDKFIRAFGCEPSISGLRNTFNLSREVCAQLKEAAKAAWVAEQKEFRECIHAAKMPEHLGISKGEFRKWRADGRIPITFYTYFQKWGRDLETTRHHPRDIGHITPEVIAGWREQDKIPRLTSQEQVGFASRPAGQPHDPIPADARRERVD
jgi:hypothetical protein